METAKLAHARRLAQDEARKLVHRQIEPEHLLLGMLRAEGSTAARVLRALGIDYARLQGAVSGQQFPPGDVHVAFDKLSMRAKQVLAFAADEARALKHNYIGTEHLLLGLVRQPEMVRDVLQQAGAAPEAIRAQVLATLPDCSEQPTFVERLRRLVTRDRLATALIMATCLGIGVLMIWVLVRPRETPCPVGGGLAIRETFVLRADVAGQICRLGEGQLQALAFGWQHSAFELTLPPARYILTYGIESAEGAVGTFRAVRWDEDAAHVLFESPFSGSTRTVGQAVFELTGETHRVEVQIDGFSGVPIIWRLEFATRPSTAPE